MRVLFISASGGGGFGRPTQRHFPLEVGRLGAQVAVFGRGTTPEFEGVVDAHVVGGDTWFHLNRRITALRRAVKTVQPDIVHVFWHPGCEFYPLMIRARRRPVWIADVRGPDAFMRRWGLVYRVLARLTPLGYPVLATPAVGIARYAFGRDDPVLLPLGYDATRFFANFHPAGPRADGLLRLVYIGSLMARRKLAPAFEALLDAIRAVPRDAPLRPVVDVYGGGGGEAGLRAIGARVPDAMRFHGLIDQAELGDVLRASDIGLSLLRNRMYDHAPMLKTMEYLACGLPVIGSDTTGNRSLLKDGENGWLVGDDPAALTALLGRLCREGVPPALRTRAIQSIKGHSWPEVVRDHVLPLYERCLAAHGPNGQRGRG